MTAFIHAKKGMLTQHHLTPISQGGDKRDPKNLLNVWDRRHRSIHHTFGNKPFSAIIDILRRLSNYININQERVRQWRENFLKSKGKERRRLRHEIATLVNIELQQPDVSRSLMVIIAEPNKWHNIFNGNPLEKTIAICERLASWKANLPKFKKG